MELSSAPAANPARSQCKSSASIIPIIIIIIILVRPWPCACSIVRHRQADWNDCNAKSTTTTRGSGHIGDVIWTGIIQADREYKIL